MIETLAEREAWAEVPALVFVGHSLGGAVATRTAAAEKFKGKVLGLAVLDVVEGKIPGVLLSLYLGLSLATSSPSC